MVKTIWLQKVKTLRLLNCNQAVRFYDHENLRYFLFHVMSIKIEMTCGSSNFGTGPGSTSLRTSNVRLDKQATYHIVR